MAEITFEQFDAVDIRSGTILTAEAIPKSEKMLKLTVSLGESVPRTIAAGIAKSYMPETLVGMRVLVVANLAPRKVMGIESQGMLLAAEAASGASVLLAGCPGVPDGSRLG